MTDALGFEIVIGNLYGYSNRQNGHVSVVIGEAVKINKQSVTLKVLKRGSSVYQDGITKEYGKQRPISPSSNALFPLSNDETRWEIEEAKELLLK